MDFNNLLPDETLNPKQLSDLDQLLQEEKLLFSREIEEYYSIEQSEVEAFVQKQLPQDAYESESESLVKNTFKQNNKQNRLPHGESILLYFMRKGCSCCYKNLKREIMHSRSEVHSQLHVSSQVTYWGIKPQILHLDR